MLDEGKAYFVTVGVLWNIFDLLSSFLVIIFAIGDITGAEWGNDIYVVAAFASFILWLKLFYFLRIFRPTSSFIRMIVEMFIDIRIFLLIFFIGIFAFSNSLYILDLIKLEQLDEEGLVEKFGISGDTYFSSIVYVYLTSLGELDTDNYNEHPYYAMYWILFFASTILIQITLLNLLIAIMGDTFDRVLEVAKESQLKEICSFITEYYHLFP
jgi:hypothetical protein